jgi:hypothetical protein
MTNQRRTKLLERTIVLILLGLLIGGLGGAAVGFITGRTATSSTSQ